MSRRGVARLAPLALVTVFGLTGCGDGGDTEPSTTQAATTSATPSETASATPSETVAETPSAANLSVTREGDTFTPNGERVELEVGETLILSITTDTAGELHVHSTPEQDISYGEGTSEHEITIARPGVVEVESHDPDLVLLQLEVR